MVINEDYIAGFFDGEGNVNKLTVKGKEYYQIRIYQKGLAGKEILEEIKSFLGFGTISETKIRNKKSGGELEMVYEYRITKKEEIISFINRVGIKCKLKKFPHENKLIDLRKQN